MIGWVDEALAIAARHRDDPAHARLALRLLVKHGRHAEAAAFEAVVEAAAPSDTSLIELRATGHRCDPQDVLAVCDQALAHQPGCGPAIYYKVIALAQLGRGEEARALLGLDRLLHVETLAPPDGSDDPAPFLEQVRREILDNPTVHRDPAGHASRHGLRTRNFPLPGDTASALLTAAIRRAVELYAQRLDGDHPFETSRPAEAGFTAWALVFQAAGHQVLHHHPEPWLTGVFYVSAPPGAPRPGAIRIGGLPAWAGIAPPWPLVTIEPEPGRLILFPSFVPHETLPTGTAEERISIAFDVKRAED